MFRHRETLKRLLRPVYHPALNFLITLIRRIRGDWKNLVFLHPMSVRQTVNRLDRTLKRNDMWHFGSVAGGDWDLGGVPVQEYGWIFTILRKRVWLGLAYDDIPEFQANLELIRRGERPENCVSETAYRAKWAATEQLYRTIASSGYKTQKDLGSIRVLNEVRVQVGRKGDLLFEEGIHRLLIAQLLELDRIPVIVTRYHAEWVASHGREIPGAS